MASPGYDQNPLPDTAGTRQSATKKRGKVTTAQKLKRYQNDVAVAQREMKDRHKDWKRHIDFYEGKQWLSATGGDISPQDGVVINHVASIVNTIVPAVTTQPPKIRAQALRPQDELTAPFVEALLNYEVMRLRVRKELQAAVYDMVIIGNGFIKVGYEFETQTIERDPDEVETDVQQLQAQQAAALTGEGPPGAGASAPSDLQEPSGLPGEPVPEPTQGLQGPPQPGMDANPMQAQLPQEAATQAQQMASAPPFGQGYGPGVSPSPTGPRFGSVPGPAQMGADQLQAPQSTLPPDALPTATEQELRASVATTQTVILKDDIFVERVSPFEVFIDPEARTMREARWVAQRLVKPLEDVKGNPAYSNTSKLKATEESKVAATHGSNPVDNDLGDYTKRVVIWEYYNLKERTLCIFAENHDKFLYEGDYSYPFEGSPFVMVRDYLIPDQLWGFGEVKMIEGAQIELNKTRTQQIVHNKRFNRKWLYRKEAFDDDGIAAMESDQDGVGVAVKQGLPLTESVMQWPDMGMPPDKYQMSQVIENDLTQLSGVSDYQRGGMLPRHVTASEANLMQSAQDLRSRDKLDRIEEASTEIGRMILRLAQTFYDYTRWVLITGNGINVPTEFDKTDIEGEYDIAVDASSTQPTNEMFAQQQAERMYQLLRPDPMINPIELIKQVLRAYKINAPERFMVVPPAVDPNADPNAQPSDNPSAPGAQPGRTEGNTNSATEHAAAVAGGQQAAGA